MTCLVHTFLITFVGCGLVLGGVAGYAPHSIHPDFYHFPDLTSIKSYFGNETHPYARRILDVFQRECLYMEEPKLPKEGRKPFIVVEGNHRGSREIIARKLARRLGGKYLTNLAPCLYESFSFLSQGSVIRRVFYLLSVYASVFNAKVALSQNKAVVLNGYWWEQVTFSLLQALREEPIPSINSDIFQHPPDLLQPDLIIYVNYPDKVENGRPNLQKMRTLKLYYKLSSKYPISILQMSKIYRVAIDEVYLNVRQNLSETRNFEFNPWMTWLTTTEGSCQNGQQQSQANRYEKYAEDEEWSDESFDE